MDTDNVAKLRRAYKLWSDTRGGSAQTWLDMMADGVALRSLPAGAAEMEYTKAKSGKSDAEQYFAGLAAAWEMVHFTAKEFIAQGDRVAVLSDCAYRFKATGKVAASPKADFFRFRDGSIVEFFEFFDTASVFAATRPDA